MIFQVKSNIERDPANYSRFLRNVSDCDQGTHMGIKEVLVSESILENL